MQMPHQSDPIPDIADNLTSVSREPSRERWLMLGEPRKTYSSSWIVICWAKKRARDSSFHVLRQTCASIAERCRSNEQHHKLSIERLER